MNDHAKTICDVASLCTIAGWFVGWLPAIATGLAILYYICQIADSTAAQRLFNSLFTKETKHECHSPDA